MRTLTIKEVIEATKGVYSNKGFEILITGVSTDSRKINKGDLFIPLTGPNFDGHDFISQAFEKGAAATFATGIRR